MTVPRPASVDAHTHLYSGLAPLGMPPPARTPASFGEEGDHEEAQEHGLDGKHIVYRAQLPAD